MTQRIMAFIDGFNVNNTVRDLGFEIDFKRLLEYLEGDDMLVRANYYACIPNDVEAHNPVMRVLDWLSYNGYNVNKKRVKIHQNEDGPKIKASVVAEISIDMIDAARHADCIILFTGDGEYRYAIERIQKTTGAYVVVFGDKATASDELRRQADSFVHLEDIRTAIQKQDPSIPPIEKEA